MPKVVIIGIDSMDKELLYKYLEELPTFQKLIHDTPDFHMTSVFPPDSDTAWASIYTGLNPAHHGIVLFVDPLKKTSIQETDYLDISNLRGKTFWDIAGKHGKKVCLIYPHAAYPVWPVNGFMISPEPRTNGFQVYPEDFHFNFEVKKFEVPTTIPDTSSDYEEYLKKCQDIVIHEFLFAENMLKTYECDIFFFYSSVLDFIQHIFWNYCDPEDPTYKGEGNPYKNAIKDFYILHDKLLGSLLQQVPDDTVVIILSDHGHAMRPVKLFNINELLRKNGYLSARDSIFSPVYQFNEKCKRFLVEIVQKTELRKIALNALRKYPRVKEFYTVPSTIDFERTVAHCSDMSGLKSYTYGGIIIQKDKLSLNEYETIRDSVINLLRSQSLPNSEEKIFEWVMKREELYPGEFISKYPDIVFQLKNTYGAGWAIKVPLFTETAAHSFFPGTHRGDTPVLFIKNIDGNKIRRTSITLMDITPSLLHIFNIGIDSLDGESIFLDSIRKE